MWILPHKIQLFTKWFLRRISDFSFRMYVKDHPPPYPKLWPHPTLRGHDLKKKKPRIYTTWECLQTNFSFSDQIDFEKKICTYFKFGYNWFNGSREDVKNVKSLQTTPDRVIRVAHLGFQLWWAKKGFNILKQEAEILWKPSNENAITLTYIVLIIAPPPPTGPTFMGKTLIK